MSSASRRRAARTFIANRCSGGRRRHPKPGMVEHARGVGVTARCDVDAGLLVEPPLRQAELVSDGSGLVEHHTVRSKYGVDVAGRPPSVVCEGHRRTAEHIEVGDNPTASQTVAEPTERILDGRPVEQRIIGAHATSSSCAATYTPRRRNAAGAWTSASTRAARVLNGNHNRRSDLDSTHEGAPRPSRAARCSASAARNTSQRSSPTTGGSSASMLCLATGGSQRYSFRNSATNRQRPDSSAPTNSTLSRAKVNGWYAWLRPCSSTPPTVIHRPGHLAESMTKTSDPSEQHSTVSHTDTNPRQDPQLSGLYGAGGTRTRDRGIMSPLLRSAELPARRHRRSRKAGSVRIIIDTIAPCRGEPRWSCLVRT
jgi:hypothetical protein